ncbi:hypothetical protein [Psychroserpens luteolus]|uniref:hypothetical protein n=1 Tax=Psychroserpens luteolus TaxID=2855840 RepID=UPI001E59C834|nr:hypothetical protein [Psychroserpens luteolus]MCD2259744.1 hypothetical protein [Psychroserpens luteolus]
MNSKDTYQFNKLKSAVISKFLERHSASSDVKQWNGDDIGLFQEDLFSEVKAKVSEKWFYTYFKNEASKLPRIDMLNLLSSYVGYDNWNAFKSAHSSEEKNKKKRIFPWPAIFIPIAIIFIVTMNSKNEFTFCFQDDLNTKIVSELDIKILQDNQSPLYFKTDSVGCFNYKTEKDKITFVVSSPYYKTDTIIRSIDRNEHYRIKLKSDNYALILKYYTSGNVKDWSSHKQKIEHIIHDDARIYRHYHKNMGVEIYSKKEFVRLLTIPTSSLDRIRILNKDFDYDKNQIITLHFIID